MDEKDELIARYRAEVDTLCGEIQGYEETEIELSRLIEQLQTRVADLEQDLTRTTDMARRHAARADAAERESRQLRHKITQRDVQLRALEVALEAASAAGSRASTPTLAPLPLASSAPQILALPSAPSPPPPASPSPAPASPPPLATPPAPSHARGHGAPAIAAEAWTAAAAAGWRGLPPRILGAVAWALADDLPALVALASACREWRTHLVHAYSPLLLVWQPHVEAARLSDVPLHYIPAPVLSVARSISVNAAHTMDRSLRYLGAKLCPHGHTLAQGPRQRPLELPLVTRINLAVCRSITDRGVALMMAGCGPRLHYLNLSACQHITDRALKDIAERGGRLNTLNLAGCSHITDAGVATVAAGCPRLASLALAGCDALSDAALAALAAHLPALHTLDVARCPMITDTGVAALAASPAPVRSLDLSHDVEVTDAALEALAGGCGASLRVLVVVGCTRLTDDGLAALREVCPRMRRLAR